MGVHPIALTVSLASSFAVRARPRTSFFTSYSMRAWRYFENEMDAALALLFACLMWSGNRDTGLLLERLPGCAFGLPIGVFFAVTVVEIQQRLLTVNALLAVLLN